MTKDEINRRLKRDIKDGGEFSHLIERTSHEQKQFQKGNTFYTVGIMKLWVQTFYRQLARLARVLKGKTLEETTQNIHFFLFNYLQYELDFYEQRLRSPANSWENRAVGIDCKSYSIFASSALKCLGIRHYIRQIKQPHWKPQKFTHVYIVVPIDQKTASLNDGHYIIDGTLKSNKEPIFTVNKDLIMEDELPHVGLNAPGRKKPRRPPRKPRTTRKTSTNPKGRGRNFPF